jgi:hypothetical protein
MMIQIIYTKSLSFTTTEPHKIAATFNAGSKEPVLKVVSVPVLKLPPTIEGLELRTGTDSGVSVPVPL